MVTCTFLLEHPIGRGQSLRMTEMRPCTLAVGGTSGGVRRKRTEAAVGGGENEYDLEELVGRKK